MWNKGKGTIWGKEEDQPKKGRTDEGGKKAMGLIKNKV